MRLDGWSVAEICSELGVKPRTVYIWFSNPKVRAELAAGLDKVNELFAQQLAEAAARGLRSLGEMASTSVEEPLDWRTKLDAIRLILESTNAPDLLPEGKLPEDPRKEFFYTTIRELSVDQIGQLGRLAAEDLAREMLAGSAGGEAVGANAKTRPVSAEPATRRSDANGAS